MLRPALKSPGQTDAAPKSGLDLIPPVIVVPRAECEFRRHRRRADGRAGLAAIALKARAELAPDHTLHIVPDATGDGVGVWAFPATDGQAARYRPETLLRQPITNGIRLIAVEPGIEGQVWESGSLVASRWWRAQPSPTDWQLFMRGAKRDESLVGTPMPHVEVPPIVNDLPAFDLTRDRLARSLSPARLLAAVGLVALGGLTYLGSQLAWTGAGNARLASRIDTLTPPAQTVLSLRRRATGELERAARSAAQQDADILLRALVGIDSILARAHADRPVITDPDTGEPLPVRAPELDSLVYEGGELLLSIGDGPPIDIPTLVADIEALPTLENANARAVGRNGLEIRADLQTANPAETPT